MANSEARESKLSDSQLSRLKGLASNATTNAAATLEAMIGHSVTIDTFEVAELEIDAAQAMLGNPEDPIAGIYLIFDGDITGHMVLTFGLETALRLVDMLMLEELGTTTEIDELSRSALGEVGNQTGSAFLNSVADTLHKDIRISPPAVIIDMAAAVLNSVVAQVSIDSDTVFMVDTAFKIGGTKAPGMFFFIPDSASLDEMSGVLD